MKLALAIALTIIWSGITFVIFPAPLSYIISFCGGFVIGIIVPRIYDRYL